MGLSQRGGLSGRGRSHGGAFFGRLERDRPCRLEQRFRYRVVLVGEAPEVALRRGNAARIVWVTNEQEYARTLVARINALAGRECTRVERWNCADNAAQSRWICMHSAGGLARAD